MYIVENMKDLYSRSVIDGMVDKLIEKASQEDIKLGRREARKEVLDSVRSKINRRHLVLLAMTEDGYRHLSELVTISWLEGFDDYRPRIDLDVLERTSTVTGRKLHEDLIALTACTSGMVQPDDDIDETILRIKKLKYLFGDRLYLEVQPHDWEPQKKLNELVVLIREVYNIPLVATNDVHYLRKGDDKVHEVLLAVGDKKLMSDETRHRYEIVDLYPKSRKEMEKSFRKQGVLGDDLIDEACDSTTEIAERCTFNLESIREESVLPGLRSLKVGNKVFDLVDSQQELWALEAICKEGWRRLEIDKKPNRKKYKERLKMELKAIIGQGFVRYFLIIIDLIRKVKERGILVGPGRGSVTASIVSWLSGITKIDPVEQDLLFFRFINPDRIHPPDVDMDFQSDRRDEVYDILKQTYGSDRAFRISNFSVLRGKASLRDVARTFGVPSSEVDRVTPLIIQRGGTGDSRRSFTVEDSIKEFPEVGDFFRKHPEMDIAMKLEGQIRHRAVHACGIVLSDDKPMWAYAPIELRKAGSESSWTQVICLDYRDAEWMGLLKIDALGLSTLEIVQTCMDNILNQKSEVIDLEKIPFDDKRVLQEFRDGNTTGSFQFDTRGLRKLTMQIQPREYRALVDANALHRPGALFSGVASQYMRRYRGLEKVTFDHPALEEFTKQTQGCCIYQEQIMQLCVNMAGFTWPEADEVRHEISKKGGIEAVDRQSDKWYAGCKERKVPDKVAKSVWNMIRQCVTGDTTIHMQRGRKYRDKVVFMRMEDLFNEWASVHEFGRMPRKKFWYVTAYDHETNRLVSARITDVWFAGERKTYKLITTCGAEIRCTGEHKFLLADRGWVELGTLSLILQSCRKNKKPLPRVMARVETGKGKHVSSVVTVKDIRACGKENVYDLSVEYPYHNYVANGFIVHNSGNYAFNVSHSAAYTALGWYTVWLKVYYPTEFIAAFLTFHKSGDKIAEGCKEAARLGVQVNKPNVNISKSGFSITGESEITTGFDKVKGVGEKASFEIIKEQPFSSLSDFLSRVKRRVVNKRVVGALAKSSAFFDFVKNDGLFIENLDSILSMKDGDRENFIADINEKRDPLMGEVKMRMTLEVLPISFGRHPIEYFQDVRQWLREMNNGEDQISDIGSLDFERGGSAIVWGVFTTLDLKREGELGALDDLSAESEEVGRRFAGCNLEDPTDFALTILPPEVYSKRSELAKVGNPVIASVSFKPSGYRFQASDVVLADDVRRSINQMVSGIEPVGVDGLLRRLLFGTRLTTVLAKYNIQDIPCNLKDILERIHGKEWRFGKGPEIEVVLEVTGLKKHVTKNSGKDMAFIEVADSRGEAIEMLAFPQVYDEIDDLDLVGKVILCEVGWLKDLHEFRSDGRGKLALVKRPKRVI
jgi:DNA-directed DNA polymerase III PolC